jgi:hypothetical protein
MYNAKIKTKKTFLKISVSTSLLLVLGTPAKT